MEQINSILDLMEITFQNGVPSNAGWLINIIAKSIAIGQILLIWQL